MVAVGCITDSDSNAASAVPKGSYSRNIDSLKELHGCKPACRPVHLLQPVSEVSRAI